MIYVYTMTLAGIEIVIRTTRETEEPGFVGYEEQEFIDFIHTLSEKEYRIIWLD
jgi:hypothetical protein